MKRKIKSWQPCTRLLYERINVCVCEVLCKNDQQQVVQSGRGSPKEAVFLQYNWDFIKQHVFNATDRKARPRKKSRSWKYSDYNDKVSEYFLERAMEGVILRGACTTIRHISLGKEGSKE